MRARDTPFLNPVSSCPCLLDLPLPPHDNSGKVPLWAGQLTFGSRGYRPASFR
jgi:hypothetical protein